MPDKIKSAEKSENKQPEYSCGRTTVKPQVNIVPDANNGISGLQQAAGNLAVQHLFRNGAIQAKLTINQPGDKYEQEADMVAKQVMRMPDPRSQVSGQVSGKTQTAQVKRKCVECEEEETLQAQQVPGCTPAVTPDLESRIQSLRGDGQPLPESTRAFFEPRFGYDFSRVRVHTGVKAAESAREVKALAYTMGNNVVFRAGQYAPQTREGTQLLAHELTHVVQLEHFPRSNVLSRWQYGRGNPPRNDFRVLNAKERLKVEAGMKFVSDVVQNSGHPKHVPCSNRFINICPGLSQQEKEQKLELIKQYNAATLWRTDDKKVLGYSWPPNHVAFGVSLFTPLQVAGTAIHEFGHNCGIGISAADEAKLEKTVRICGLM